MSCRLGDDTSRSQVSRTAAEGGLYFAIVQSRRTTMADVEEGDRCDVKKVASEFRLREDGALALQLQEHEFRHHYTRNKEDRHTARLDVKAAKSAYLAEVRDAGIISERQLQTIGMDDAWMSNEIEARIEEQEQLEEQNRKLTSMQDEEYAQYLQMKEKEKIEEARRRRLQKRLARDSREETGAVLTVEASKPPSSFQYDPVKAGINGDKIVMTSPREPPKVAEKPVRNASKTNSNGRGRSVEEEIENEIDREEKRKDSQEKQDEEFARLMQEEELVRQKRIIEDRDRRLALKLQRIETSEFKRQQSENEARQALSMASTKPPHPEYDDEKKSPDDSRRSLRSTGSGTGYDSYDSSSDRGAVGGNRQSASMVKGPGKGSHNVDNERSMERAYSVAGGATKEDYYRARKSNDGFQATVVPSNSKKSQSMKTKPNGKGQSRELSKNGGVPSPDYPGAKGGFVNIAESIDPTYKRSSKVNGTTNDVENANADSQHAVVPVMQNVRRTRSNEQRPDEKRPKSGKCKQQ